MRVYASPWSYHIIGRDFRVHALAVELKALVVPAFTPFNTYSSVVRLGTICDVVSGDELYFLYSDVSHVEE